MQNLKNSQQSGLIQHTVMLFSSIQKSFIFLSCAIMLGLLSQPSIAAHDKVYEITILHTNDFHARFRPISKYDNNCSAKNNAKGKCFGGTARLISAIEDARSRHSNTILLDGGDQFQGTLFYNLYKGKVAAEMMNKLGYDGMAVGNHEFDDGPETLRAFMDSVNFPVLMANANVDMEPELKGKLQKSTTLYKNNQKIGLIGVVTEEQQNYRVLAITLYSLTLLLLCRLR